MFAKQEAELTLAMMASGSWKTTKLKDLDLEADGAPVGGGYFHPLLKVEPPAIPCGGGTAKGVTSKTAGPRCRDAPCTLRDAPSSLEGASQRGRGRAPAASSS